MSNATEWDGNELLSAFSAATQRLEAHRAEIDALNVYPVPDGDTGANLSWTMNDAVAEATRSVGIDPGASVVADRIAYGSLLGARGNSGVILSQILRGFARAIAGLDRIDGRDIAAALQLAAETAYSAVLKPVEGTMLTVIRVAAEHATRSATRDSSLSNVLDAALNGASEALADTPRLLITLRQSGVVDAGGMGLVVMLEGFLAAATGQPIALATPVELAHMLDLSAMSIDHDGYGYCTNFLISGGDIPFDQVRGEIAAMGQSAVIAGDPQLVKVHIHTEHPGSILEYALTWGALSQIKIDNMDSQARDFLTSVPPDQAADARSEIEIAVIAVVSGHGVASAFRDLGAADVIAGGDTMNPSVEEMLAAVETSTGRAVVLLPNNSNVLMGANQVRTLSDRPVEVVPTLTIPQGLGALSAFRPEITLAENVAAMTRAATSVTSIEISQADTDAQVNDIPVRVSQYLAFIDKNLVYAGDDLIDVTISSLKEPIADGAELVTVFLGSAVDTSISASIRGHLTERYGNVEFEVLDGDQPLHLLVIAVE